MMAIVLCGRNPHPQVLSSSLQALLDVEFSCKAKTFQTTLLEVLQVPGKTQYGAGGGGNGTMAQADRWQKYVWRCFTSLGSAFIFCFSLRSRLHLNKGVWDSKRLNFSLLFRASLKHVLTLSPRHPRQD